MTVPPKQAEMRINMEDGTRTAAVVLAMLVGCLLPIGAKKLGFDPAVMASPFITTIVDALSLIVYFRVATVILGI